MSRYLLVGTLLLVSLLSGCSQSNRTEIATEPSETPNESRMVLESTTETSTSEVSYQIIPEEETLETTTKTTTPEIVNLGAIQYKDLDESEPIQAKAKYFGCSIEDDGTSINFIPAMSATIQNLQLYLSGNGNEDYYNDFLAGAVEVSLLTRGKPVTVYNAGLGEVIITAVDGTVTYSI